MSVDLPAELSPTRPRTSPGNRRRSTSASARTAPKALLMPRISMIGCSTAIDCSSTGAAPNKRSPGEQAFDGRRHDRSLAQPDIADHGEQQYQADEHIDPMLGQHEGGAVG